MRFSMFRRGFLARFLGRRALSLPRVLGFTMQVGLERLLEDLGDALACEAGHQVVVASELRGLLRHLVFAQLLLVRMGPHEAEGHAVELSEAAGHGVQALQAAEAEDAHHDLHEVQEAELRAVPELQLDELIGFAGPGGCELGAHGGFVVPKEAALAEARDQGGLARPAGAHQHGAHRARGVPRQLAEAQARRLPHEVQAKGRRQGLQASAREQQPVALQQGHARRPT